MHSMYQTNKRIENKREILINYKQATVEVKDMIKYIYPDRVEREREIPYYDHSHLSFTQIYRPIPRPSWIFMIQILFQISENLNISNYSATKVQLPTKEM